jgi:hypothetical protein
VVETGRGTGGLTSGQLDSLSRFKGKGAGFKNPDVTKFSDGSVIYSTKVPARDIPGSYALYEKHVDAYGKKIKTNKITVGPAGEVVHIKPK